MQKIVYNISVNCYHINVQSGHTVKLQNRKTIMNIQTIIKQQMLITGFIKVASWGAHGWVATALNTLTFKVNAHHFKGMISITLDEGLDLYDIHFFDNYSGKSFFSNKKPSTRIQPMTGIYCDQLVDLIDDNIERIDSYIN